ncbi:hypothetical protein Tco_0133094 [Tanacetum coccineum]
MENLNMFYLDIGPSSSTEEVRPVLETMAYNDKYKKVLNKIWKEKVELDGMIMEEEEQAIIKVKVVGRGFLHTIGGIVNTPKRLFSTFDGICHQTFRAARSDVLRTAESDNDDEEEYEIKRNKFGEPMYGLKPAAYLNCNDPAERSLALQAVINLFWKISVWKRLLVSLVYYLYRYNTLTGNLITRVVILTKRKQKDSGVLRYG